MSLRARSRLRATREARLPALLLVVAVALAGCGGGAGDPLGSPDDTGADETASDHDDPADAATWLGLSRSEADALAVETGWELRVAREDDMVFPLDDDVESGRITVEYDYRGAGEPIVTVATVEADDGTVSHAEADDTGPDNMVDDGTTTGSPDDQATSGPDHADDGRSPQEVAASYLGLTEQQAQELAAREDRTMRVGRRGDDSFALTEDYQFGRITVELDPHEDTWVVVKVVLESEGGPVTVE